MLAMDLLVITDQPKIVLQRLNAFLDQVGKDRVEKVPGYINI